MKKTKIALIILSAVLLLCSCADTDAENGASQQSSQTETSQTETSAESGNEETSEPAAKAELCGYYQKELDGSESMLLELYPHGESEFSFCFSYYDKKEGIMPGVIWDGLLSNGKITGGTESEVFSIIQNDSGGLDVEYLINGEAALDVSGEYYKSDYTPEYPDYEVPAVPAPVYDRNCGDLEIDSAIAKAIRAESGMGENAVITKEFLSTITELSVFEGKPITLAGCEYMQNLQSISISQSYLSDITPLLANTKLRRIDISWSYISFLPSNISSLASLTSLYLSKNLLSDLSPLEKMSGLRELCVSENRITDLTPIKDLQLDFLDIGGNYIGDITVIGGNESLKNALSLKYEDYKELQKLVKNTLDGIITDDMSDLQKEVAIMKKISAIAEYGEGTRKMLPDGLQILKYGWGVCGDYADAFSALCNAAGLRVINVDSDTHRWNMINLGGTWYHVDPLWNDTEVEWEYFNVSTAMVMRDSAHVHDLLYYPQSESDMSKLAYYSDEIK